MSYTKPFAPLSLCAVLLSIVAGAASLLGQEAPAAALPPQPAGPAGAAGALPYTPVTTPNGATLPYRRVDGVKEFHLVVEEVDREFAPGMKVKCWGYNGRTPGPTIEAVEGDRVRILVTNKLPSPTAVHWHGVLLPSGMDGVGGVTQRHIPPGDTFSYEFTLKQHGTQMYHSHSDEMVQMGLGAMGFFIIHPKVPETPKIDRDFCIFLNEWFVQPGASRPDINVMTEFNLFTFNSRVYPGTDPLIVRTGDRVRIRFANVGQDVHPIHLHGYYFMVTGTDGGRMAPEAWQRETTTLVSPGQTRQVEFVADAPGDWAMHCHRRHHPMNAMGHDIPNPTGVSQKGLEENIRKLLPGYMGMGETGMYDMQEMNMEGPPNTLPMMAGMGNFGPVGMGGMFTILKVRDQLTSYDADPGWYENPPGTVSETIYRAPGAASTGPSYFVCPTHVEVIEHEAGTCPKCGAALQPPVRNAPPPGAPADYVCPDHPEVGQKLPGRCGKCFKQMKPATAAPGGGQATFTCPMHPEVVSDKPGDCPKCGMHLTLLKPAPGAPATPAADWTCSMHPEVSEKAPGRCPTCGMNLELRRK